MKIAESNIQLASSRTAVEYFERQELLSVWRQGRETASVERKNGHDETLKNQAEKLAKEAAKVSLSEVAKQRAAEVPAAAEASVPEEDAEFLTDLNMRILKALFEKLTGRKFRVYTPQDLQQQAATSERALVEGAQEQAAQAGAGWGCAMSATKPITRPNIPNLPRKGWWSLLTASRLRSGLS